MSGGGTFGFRANQDGFALLHRECRVDVEKWDSGGRADATRAGTHRAFRLSGTLLSGSRAIDSHVRRV